MLKKEKTSSMPIKARSSSFSFFNPAQPKGGVFGMLSYADMTGNLGVAESNDEGKGYRAYTRSQREREREKESSHVGMTTFFQIR